MSATHERSDQPRSVMYVEDGALSVVAERIRPSQVHTKLAGEVLALGKAALTVDFDQSGWDLWEQTSLTEDTFEIHFRPDSEDRRAQTAQFMIDEIDGKGSQYWAIRACEDFTRPLIGIDSELQPGQLVSYLKVTESSHHENQFLNHTGRICDIQVVTHPDVRRQGLASTLAHAAYVGGQLDPAACVVVEGFADSASKRFMTHALGLTPKPELWIGDYPLMTDDRLSRTLFQSAEDMTLKEVVRRLEKRTRWLRSAVVLHV